MMNTCRHGETSCVCALCDIEAIRAAESELSCSPTGYELIYLIDLEGDKVSDNYVWCDDPAPSPEMDEKDAIPYIRLDIAEEMSLMLDVFNSCIVTGTFPAVESECAKKILELMDKAGRKPTAVI
ncbi:MAG: hypothetical protein GY750_21165 [Lentisphaerae bacterium]|nr:hypothetical protein [Lentisphaerota bacterium]